MDKGFLLPFCILMFSTCVTLAQKNSPIEAIALIAGEKVKGNVTFTQNACGENVHIRVYLTGLSPGLHGFHVHDKGDLSNGCASTGGHYNPDKMDHGAPGDDVRHTGDLGNVKANADGIVETTITDHVISLTGARSIVGRAIVVHDGEDDLGKGLHPDSKKTGNAGGRAGCGIIGIKEESFAGTCSGSTKMSLNLSFTILAFLYFVYNLFN